MDTKTPQPSPARSKTDRVRPPKLRMSCDACSNTKTKCDQTRPSCLRCQKNNLDCNYSISQRKGKPPAASRDRPNSIHGRERPQVKPCVKTVQEEQSSYEQESQLTTIGPTCLMDQDASVMDLSLSMYEDAVPDLWQSYLPHMSDFTANDPRSTYDMMSFDGDFSDMLDVGSHMPDQSEESLTSAPFQSAASASTISTPSTNRYNCTRLASSTLDSLNAHFQSCSASIIQETRSASFDQILIINEAAVENAHQLLSCPCSLSQQSTLMLSLIIDKILTLYQANIRSEAPSGAMTPCSDVSSEQLVHNTPITIGVYKMDARDKQWMRMHIVSNEVRKAASLVERYADRYRGLSCQDREDKSIYTALTTLLRRRLKEVVTDISTALRNSRP